MMVTLLIISAFAMAQTPHTDGEGYKDMSISESGLVEANCTQWVYCVNAPTSLPTTYRWCRVVLTVNGVTVRDTGFLIGMPFSKPEAQNVGPIQFQYQLDSGTHDVSFTLTSSCNGSPYENGNYVWSIDQTVTIP